MNPRFCLSCGMPLDTATGNISDDYCNYCTTSEGQLKSRQEVLSGIARYLKMLQPDLDDVKAASRAESYMNAMPAWAED